MTDEQRRWERWAREAHQYAGPWARTLAAVDDELRRLRAENAGLTAENGRLRQAATVLLPLARDAVWQLLLCPSCRTLASDHADDCALAAALSIARRVLEDENAG